MCRLRLKYGKQRKSNLPTCLSASKPHIYNQIIMNRRKSNSFRFVAVRVPPEKYCDHWKKCCVLLQAISIVVLLLSFHVRAEHCVSFTLMTGSWEHIHDMSKAWLFTNTWTRNAVHTAPAIRQSITEERIVNDERFKMADEWRLFACLTNVSWAL